MPGRKPIDVKLAYRLRFKGFTWKDVARRLPRKGPSFDPGAVERAVAAYLKGKRKK